MGFVRSYSTIIRLGIGLALIGQLKFCTANMMGLAAENYQRGIMPYSEFSRMLTK